MELNQKDVVTMNEQLSFSAGRIFMVGELRTAIQNYVKEPLGTWVREKGVECEVLQAEGGGWQKGRMYLRIEFIPDNAKVPVQDPSTVVSEPVSPLDDLRSQLDTQ